jgi:peptidoglycan hydrolase-like protein with peptidoglycan-binding domain
LRYEAVIFEAEMLLRTALYLGLTLSLAAGLGVFANAAITDTPNSKPKTATSKTTGRSSQRSYKPSYKKVNSRHKDKGQMAPTPERISEIQQALAKNGSFSNAPNGKWDDSTVGAMKTFQSVHGLSPSGKLDALTLEKLGLGSQTAGIAEPVAPPNSSSRLTGQAPQSSRQ